MLRDISDPFTIPDAEFRKHFRLSKEITKVLIDSLKPYIPDRKRSTGIPVEIKILTALSFFAHGSYQKCVGSNAKHCMNQTTLSRIVSKVSQAMVDHMLLEWVKFPQVEADRARVKLSFQERYHFPGIIGAIDCTHVAIIAPRTEEPVRPGIAYYNRKGFYSLNVQLICDSDLRILNCCAKFPGSVHDSAIWTLSPIKTHLQQLYINRQLGDSWLIGDSGYGLQPWLLTPITDADDNTPEAMYTKAHISARNTIERCNGVLKQRFRCLLSHRVLHYDPVKAAKIVLSCVVLHNMAIHYRLGELDVENNGNDPTNGFRVPPWDEVDVNWLAEGRKIRQNLIRNHFV